MIISKLSGSLTAVEIPPNHFVGDKWDNLIASSTK